MYINNEDFVKWATRLSQQIKEIGKDLKSLINTGDVFDKDEKPLDNQDVSLLLNVSYRTLQRYRSDGLLPFFKLGQKIYYKTVDVRDFVYKNGDYWDRKRFEEKMNVDEKA